MKRARFTWIAYAIMICSLTTFAQPDTLWTRQIASSTISQLFAADDGGILLVVNHPISHTNGTIELLKLSADGDSLWSVPIELPNTYDECVEAEMDWNGDLLLTCNTSTENIGGEFQLFRVNQSGEILGTEDLSFDGFRLGASDSTIVVIPSPAHWTTNLAVAKVVANGDTLWSDSYALGDTITTITYAVREGTNRIFVLGMVRRWPENYRSFVLCIGSNGDSLWFRHSEENPLLWSTGLIQQDGSIILIDSKRGLKLGVNGETLWQWVSTNQSGDTTYIQSVGNASNQGFFAYSVYGYYPAEGWLLRIGDDGMELWENCCWRTSLEGYYGGTAVQLSRGEFVIGESLHPSGMPHSPPRVLITCFEPEQISVTEPATEIASSFALHPNYPNPFNATTEITFDLPHAMQARLKVYDVLGREVAELAGGVMNSGSHTILYDASLLSSGVYFYRLEAGEFGETRKMVLLK